MKGSELLFLGSVDWVLISRGPPDTDREESNTAKELKVYYFKNQYSVGKVQVINFIVVGE